MSYDPIYQKDSHRQFKHPNLAGITTFTGAEEDAAKSYQERQIAEVIAKSEPKD